MAYIRISYMVPKPGQEQPLDGVLDELSTFYAGAGGYVLGYRLHPHQGDPMKRMGRVGVWETEEAAVRSAQADHVLALRSRMMQLIDEDSHVELSFVGEQDRG
jgi:hypothetical protein